MIFYFHEGRQHNIDDVCVEFCFILELIYSSDFHEGRQYFMLTGAYADSLKGGLPLVPHPD